MGAEEGAEARGDEEEKRDEAGQVLRFEVVEDEMAGLSSMSIRIKGR